MNTMQLACFLTVAETLNFAQAAERLHVTQPAVTQQIHSLEAELNLRLFRRTTRTVELTQDGLLFLGDAKAMFEIFLRAKKRAEYAVADTRETFVVGCHSNNDILHLSPALERMKERFPSLYPVFRVVPFQHLYQRLSEEAVDVVIAFREGGLKKAIHYRELVKVPVVCVGTADLLPGGMERVPLRQLQQGPLIVLDPQKCPDEYRALLHHILADHSPMGVYFCDALEAAVVLAQAGYGIATLPDFLLNRIPSLTYVPVSDVQPMSYGVYYKTLSGHPLRKAFVSILADHFSGVDT